MVAADAGEEEEEKDGDGMLEEHYLSHAKRGIVLTTEDLKKFCRRKGIACGYEDIRKLRYKYKQTARFAKYKTPGKYMGSSVDKLGNIMIDLAEYKKNLRAFNQQNQYFLVGVDCLSQKLSCIPMTHKTQEKWEEAILSMMRNDFPYVTTIITDRDTAISGKAFQRSMKERYGINWIHLRTRSKAFKAERMIRFLKTRLSTALAFNEKGDNDWLQHLPGILEDYNERFINGTTIRRRDASKKNYLEILAQKMGGGGVADPEAYFNVSVLGNFTPEMSDRIFKYKVGDRVMLATYVDYSNKPARGAFEKKSVTGSFGKKVYSVRRQLLKSNAKFFLSKVYELEGLRGLFYETELIPALFSEAPPPPEQSLAGERKREGAAAKTTTTTTTTLPLAPPRRGARVKKPKIITDV
jgi:hypothetical protein